MIRQPRLDAPNALHHVMVRRIERARIFRDDTDRAAFVARLAALAQAGTWTVYACVKMRDAAISVGLSYGPASRARQARLAKQQAPSWETTRRRSLQR